MRRPHYVEGFGLDYTPEDTLIIKVIIIIIIIIIIIVI